MLACSEKVSGGGGGKKYLKRTRKKKGALKKVSLSMWKPLEKYYILICFTWARLLSVLNSIIEFISICDTICLTLEVTSGLKEEKNNFEK